MSNWTPIRQAFGSGFLEMVDPRKIERHDICQPRVNGTDPVVVAEYASDMRAYDEAYQDSNIIGWQKFLRIACVKTAEGAYILYSGFHRLAAMLEVGYETIEVYYVDGTLQDAVMLSKGENANNGIRRTNADKAHVVQSCLLDSELNKWSNEQIAEWCGVAPKTVKNHEDRLCKLQEKQGKDYQRPAVRLYLKADGSIGEKDTSEIGKRDPAGCRKALKKQLTAQGNLDDVDATELAKTYNLTTAQVEKLRDEVWESELARARKRWEKSYTKVRTAWMNDEALSKNVKWETFTAVAMERVDMSLSAETFTEADSRIKSCTDYKLLQSEADSFITLGFHIRTPAFWVSDLLPKSAEETEKEAAAAAAKLIAETEVIDVLKAHYQERQSWEGVSIDALRDTYDIAPARIYTLMKEVREASYPVCSAEAELTESELRDKINPAISKWKAARKGTGVSYASKTMFIAATKQFHNLPKGTDTDVHLLDKLLKLLTSPQPIDTFDQLIKQQCDGKSVHSEPSDKEHIHNLLDEIEDKVNGITQKESVRDPSDTYPSADDANDSDAIETALVAWKEKREYLPHLSAATKEMVIDAAKRYYQLEKNDDIDAAKVLGLLSSDALTFKGFVEQAIEGVNIFAAPREGDPVHLTQFHVSYYRRDPGEIEAVSCHTYASPQLNDIPMSQVPIPLKEWLKRFVSDVKGLTPAADMGIDPDEVSLSDLDIDFEAVINTLQSLLEQLGQPRDMKWTSDGEMLDYFLEMKTIPTCREMVYLMLDFVVTLLMERES